MKQFYVQCLIAFYTKKRFDFFEQNMKKFTIILAIITFNFQLSTFNSFAQPNGGFENWHTEFSYEDPDGWQTYNFLTNLNPPNDLSAFKAIGIDKHSGNYALKISTIHVINNPLPTQIRDTAGGTFTGKLSYSPFSFTVGFSYTARPEKLEFWSKYTPVGNDTAAVIVALFKRNGSIRDTIAQGILPINAISTYSLFQLPLTYTSSAFPDSAAIGFFSSYADIKRVGSTLFLDDIAFTGWVGIDESLSCESEKIHVFPNPAKDNVSITADIYEADNASLFNVSGKLIGVYKIIDHTVSINTTALANGIYLYKISDKKDKILQSGKFNIVK